jgi:integrase
MIDRRTKLLKLTSRRRNRSPMPYICAAECPIDVGKHLVSKKPQRRIRSKIEGVLAWAVAGGYRDGGTNPASWAVLQHLLPSRAKLAKVEHFSSVDYREVPGFMAALRTREGYAERALELLIMTATRSNETLGARWEEISLDEALWVIPPARMKNAVEHRVPLPPQAVDMLRNLPREEGNPYCFISSRRNKPLSDAALVAVMRRMGRAEVPHGFRSSFANFAHERTGVSHILVETSLAHAVGDQVERSYRTTDLLNDRRRLMERWAAFITGPAVETGATVTPMRAAPR